MAHYNRDAVEGSVTERAARQTGGSNAKLRPRSRPIPETDGFARNLQRKGFHC